jgi:hypothetical protein
MRSKMMKKLGGILAIIVAGTLGLSAAAQARGYGDGYGKYLPQHRFEKRVDRRQDRQWDRIQNGIDSGELSRGEARRLMRGQRRIARMEDRFESDGYISPRERRKLERALNRNSKRITRAKHNDHQGYGYRRGWHGPHRHYAEPYAYEWSDDSYGSDSSLGTSSVQRGDFTISWYPSN